MNVNEFKRHLEMELIPFWNELKDTKNGGFYGEADGTGVPKKDAVKGVALNNRILWFYSAAYSLLKKPELRSMADHAYLFLVEQCMDHRDGAVYESINHDGNPYEETKYTYNQASAICALSAYYEASGKIEALKYAYTLYRLIETQCRDAEGYLEKYNCEFFSTLGEKGVRYGVKAERTMNTLLYVLEAYSELYRVDKAETVRDSLKEILFLFRNKVYHSNRQSCELLFNHEYCTLVNVESYGKNIEVSWVIDRACDVLAEKEIQEAMTPMIDGLVEEVYRNAVDEECRAVNNERKDNLIDRQKLWWVQGEAVVGFYNAYQRQLQKKEYFRLAKDVWTFIQNYLINKRSGEWYETIPYHGVADASARLVHSCKGPFHTGRMCIEMIKRLD